MRLCPDCGLPLEVRGGEELDVLEVTYLADIDALAGDAGAAEVGTGEDS